MKKFFLNIFKLHKLCICYCNKNLLTNITCNYCGTGGVFCWYIGEVKSCRKLDCTRPGTQIMCPPFALCCCHLFSGLHSIKIFFFFFLNFPGYLTFFCCISIILFLPSLSFIFSSLLTFLHFYICWWWGRPVVGLFTTSRKRGFLICSSSVPSPMARKEIHSSTRGTIWNCLPFPTPPWFVGPSVEWGPRPNSRRLSRPYFGCIKSASLIFYHC